MWEASCNGDEVIFRHVSPDGDEGYPGEVTLEAVYSLNDENELSLEYRATTTAATPINICNHTYFNLAGEVSAVNVFVVCLFSLSVEREEGDVSLSYPSTMVVHIYTDTTQ